MDGPMSVSHYGKFYKRFVIMTQEPELCPIGRGQPAGLHSVIHDIDPQPLTNGVHQFQVPCGDGSHERIAKRI